MFFRWDLEPLCKLCKNFRNFTGKHPCQSLFLIKLQFPRSSALLKRLHHRCFRRRPFSQNTSSACLWNKLIWSNLVRVMIQAKQLKKCMFLLLLRIGYWIFLKIDFYSTLSNGSLAHKTKHYKGMLLIRTEKSYFKIN